MDSTRTKGFTLIELLVVIAVIGILASVVLASLNGARVKAKDVKIKLELAQIAKALELHYDTYGTYAVIGGGYYDQGNGWVLFEYLPGYPKAIAKKLNEEGFLGVMETGSDSYGNYMLYLCDNNQRYSLSATINNPSAEEIIHSQTTCNALGENGTYDHYGKNYAIGN